MKLTFKLSLWPTWALASMLVAPILMSAMAPTAHEGFFEEPTSIGKSPAAKDPLIGFRSFPEVKAEAELELQKGAEDPGNNPFMQTLSGDLTGAEERSSLISNLGEVGNPLTEASKSDVITVEKSTPTLYKRVAENVRGLVDVLRAIDFKSVSIAAREQINKVLDLLIQLGSKIANLTSKSSAAEREKIRHSVDAAEEEFERLVPLLPSEVMQQMRDRAKPVFQNARNSLVILT